MEENREKGLDAGFDGTPPQVMHETVKFIKAHWGYRKRVVLGPTEKKSSLENSPTNGTRPHQDAAPKQGLPLALPLALALFVPSPFLLWRDNFQKEK